MTHAADVYLTCGIRAADNGRLYLRVDDHDAVLPLPCRSDACEESGRGLLIVAVLIGEWGVDLTGPGKSTWARYPKWHRLCRPAQFSQGMPRTAVTVR
ncbi:hypothetical protein GCM10023205_01490 [Yinghuangia aomiensis]|uniref:Histidine kinase-like ATPase domain-containing protein n=1 Tax=Yinghuangia aomiensis TaxID=676205 RepID=A0ABP9GN99_9ACTN